MPLTPQDVQDKQFATVRLKEGYDMEEVDDFLDEVQAELERLHRENEELRDKLAAVTRGGGLAAAESLPSRQEETPKQPASPAVASVAEAASAAGQGDGPPSDAAAKVLALAQKTADELVADAKEEAERLLSDARQRAEKIDAEIKAKVSKIESEARQRAEAMEQEAAQRKQETFGALEAECAELERRRDELRDFEREYRSRLKAYLQSELRKLETGAVDEVPVPVGQASGPAADDEASGQAPAGGQASGAAYASGNASPASAPAGNLSQAPSGNSAPAPSGGASPAPSANSGGGASANHSASSNDGSSNSTTTTGGGGSLRSVASLLEDDER